MNGAFGAMRTVPLGQPVSAPRIVLLADQMVSSDRRLDGRSTRKTRWKVGGAG